MTMTPDTNLKARLFNAFASRPRPTQITRPAVGQHESAHLRELLSTKKPKELTANDLQTVVEGNLWMLSPEAFLYFLPAFLHLALESYHSISVFASELIGALTEPSRKAVVDALDEVARNQTELSLPADITDLLREQQLEWFDSGVPTAIFHERFDKLTHEEGAAILAFFDAFQQAHGADFPGDELGTIVKNYWSRYKTS
jgi:hypothetical protein